MERRVVAQTLTQAADVLLTHVEEVEAVLGKGQRRLGPAQGPLPFQELSLRDRLLLHQPARPFGRFLDHPVLGQARQVLGLGLAELGAVEHADHITAADGAPEVLAELDHPAGDTGGDPRRAGLVVGGGSGQLHLAEGKGPGDGDDLDARGLHLAGVELHGPGSGDLRSFGLRGLWGCLGTGHADAEGQGERCREERTEDRVGGRAHDAFSLEVVESGVDGGAAGSSRPVSRSISTLSRCSSSRAWRASSSASWAFRRASSRSRIEVSPSR